MYSLQIAWTHGFGQRGGLSPQRTNRYDDFEDFHLLLIMFIHFVYFVLFQYYPAPATGNFIWVK